MSIYVCKECRQRVPLGTRHQCPAMQAKGMQPADPGDGSSVFETIQHIAQTHRHAPDDEPAESDGGDIHDGDSD